MIQGTQASPRKDCSRCGEKALQFEDTDLTAQIYKITHKLDAVLCRLNHLEEFLTKENKKLEDA